MVFIGKREGPDCPCEYNAQLLLDEELSYFACLVYLFIVADINFIKKADEYNVFLISIARNHRKQINF